jgi:hypothetical protein
MAYPVIKSDGHSAKRNEMMTNLKILFFLGTRIPRVFSEWESGHRIASERHGIKEEKACYLVLILILFWRETPAKFSRRLWALRARAEAKPRPLPCVKDNLTCTENLSLSHSLLSLSCSLSLSHSLFSPSPSLLSLSLSLYLSCTENLHW